MTVRSDDVLLVHPGKQHAYEVAVALQEHGRLLRFVTGIYDTPSSWLRHAADFASGIADHDRMERLWTKRSHPALDAGRVTTWPLAELLSRTVGRLGPIRALTGERSDYLFVNWFFDRAIARALLAGRYKPRAVYAFLGAARHTFDACRQLGIRTILDVPIILTAMDTLREERIALNLPTEQRAVSKAHIDRELSGADWIIAPSAAVVESVRAAGYSGGINEVPFGGNTKLFRPGPQRDGRFRVVFAGRIEMRKGLHYLVQAWHEAGIPGELLLAGSVGEPEFVRRLRQQYTGTVREVGNLTESELADLFASADVFAMPSLAEGSAVVTYEALAAGLPCLVTHETGSVVRNGVEGFVVPTRSPTALAARLRQLYEDRALRRSMSIAARARAEEFSWESYRERLMRAIDSALEPPQAWRAETIPFRSIEVP